MGWRRGTALSFAGLVFMACGPRVAPSAHVSPAPSPAETSPIATPIPTQDGITASVTCSGRPATAMSVVAGAFVYDVADPVRPRLVCRSANTVIHVLDGNAIAYTAVVADHVVIVRRDLATGAESRIAQLRIAPRPYYWAWAGWTWDGSLEVYTTAGAPRADGRWLVSVHLFSNGADNVLYTLDAGPGGLEGRWGPRGVLAFSPDRAYLAISDFPFYIYGENVRIFSVADQRQKFATKGTPSGGTWIANDRFVWASGSLMQWSPSTGVTLLRSEYWYGVTGSGDGHWLAGMLFAKLDANSYDNSKPRGLIVAVGGGTTFQPTGLASSPGFVTPTVVWYAEEGPSTEGGLAGDTSPTGVIRAFNLASASDQAVRFVAGEAPTQFQCCAPRG